MAQTIQVTRPIIEAASVRDSRRCMIAEAIQIANPHWKQILVDLQTIRWSNPRTGKRYVALTPEEASIALIKFDRGDEDIQPFHLTLRPIQVTQTRGHERKSDDQLRMEGIDPSDPEQMRAANKSKRMYKQVSRAGRAKVRRRSSHPKDTSLVIEGGHIRIPTGHLSGSAKAVTHPRGVRPLPEPAKPGDNVRNSSTAIRAFGRRLLVQ